jgi:hypothetical protein
MMIAINETKQFQTLSLLARTIFELALEIRAIIGDPDAEKKIELFSRVELLRSARQVVAFYDGHPDAQLYQQQMDLIAKYGIQIDAEEAAMWPTKPGVRKSPLKHWTRKSVRQRAKDLGPPFNRIYEVFYAQLSWMTHSGVVSPLNMTNGWVTSYVSVVYSIAIDSYVALLEMLVVPFKLSATNEHIMRKIVCNRDLGFTSTKEEGEAVLRKHGLSWYFEPPTPWADGQSA